MDPQAEVKSVLKSQLMGTAAGCLVALGAWSILSSAWSNVLYPLIRIIPWDWAITIGERVRIDCGGCAGGVLVGVLCAALGVVLLKYTGGGQ